MRGGRRGAATRALVMGTGSRSCHGTPSRAGTASGASHRIAGPTTRSSAPRRRPAPTHARPSTVAPRATSASRSTQTSAAPFATRRTVESGRDHFSIRYSRWSITSRSRRASNTRPGRRRTCRRSARMARRSRRQPSAAPEEACHSRATSCRGVRPTRARRESAPSYRRSKARKRPSASLRTTSSYSRPPSSRTRTATRSGFIQLSISTRSRSGKTANVFESTRR